MDAEQFHKEVWMKRVHVSDGRTDLYMEMEEYAKQRESGLRTLIGELADELRERHDNESCEGCEIAALLKRAGEVKR